jgi:hypothetical protein
MKKLITTLVLAACTVAATATIATATTTTTTDVHTAAAAEAHVISLLHTYTNTAAWKAQFKKAAATQNADLAKVNSDITPTAPTAGALLSLAGNGTLSTATFTVSAAAGGWHVNYTFDNPNGYVCIFDWTTYQGQAVDYADSGPNALAASGGGTEHYYNTGSFHLDVGGSCNWTVKVWLGS